MSKCRALIAGALCALAACATSSPARRGETPTILSSNVSYPGVYSFYAGMTLQLFNPALTETRDPTLAGGTSNLYYTNTLLYPSAFPNGWNMTWIMSTAYAFDYPVPKGVYGYLGGRYCNYNNGTTNPTGCVQRQINNVTTLSSQFNFALTGADLTDDFSVLHEMFLTNTQGNQNDHALEVGVYLHPCAQTLIFHFGGSLVGSGNWTDSFGRLWTVRRNGQFVTAVLGNGTDILSGQFDWVGYFAFLKAAGTITGSEWFNGMALGIEPHRNGGTMKLNSWVLVYN